MIGVPLVTSLYTAMNVAYMSVLSYSEMVSEPAVAVVSHHHVELQLTLTNVDVVDWLCLYRITKLNQATRHN